MRRLAAVAASIAIVAVAGAGCGRDRALAASGDEPSDAAAPGPVALVDAALADEAPALTDAGTLDAGVIDATSDRALPAPSDLATGGLGPPPAPTPTTTDAPAIALVAADLDHDGRLDFVQLAPDGSTLTTVRNDGAGPAFSLAASASSPQPLIAIALAARHDGRFDLFGAASGDAALVHYVIDATLALTPAPSLPVGGAQLDVAAADVDGDGSVDLAVGLAAGTTSPLHLFAGDGAGAFTERWSSGVGARESRLAFGDVNGDGRLDVLGQDGPLRIAVSSPGTAWTYGRAYDISTYLGALGDFDGDGRVDVVTTTGNGSVSTISLLAGDGAGGFALPSPLVELPPQTSGDLQWPSALIAADLDGDGRADAICALDGDIVLGLRIERSVTPVDGALSPFIDYTMTERDLPIAGATVLVTGDFDGDGALDLLAAGPSLPTTLALRPGR